MSSDIAFYSCSLGGWTVEAPLAEGPAEVAGILRGERILQIGVRNLSKQTFDSSMC